MVIVDICIILFLVYGFYLGWRRGLITSLLLLVSSLIVFWLASILKEPVSAILITHCPYLDFGGVLKGISSLNIVVYEGIAYFLCVLVLGIIMKLAIRLSGVLNKILNKIKILALPNHVLGGVFCTLEHFVFAFMIVFLMSIVPKTNTYVMDSKVGSMMVENTPLLSNATRNISTSINEIVKMSDIKTEEDIDGAALEILLKYNIVTVDSAKELHDAGKLKIDKFDEIIEKYNK